MSGDAQPRKRRDKRRRKAQVEARRAEEYAEEREILQQLSTNSEPEEEELYPNLKDCDEVIHVHKDADTGGNIVTKLIFFLLMGGLAVMIGFILLEHRGTTDEDHDVSSKKETPWSLQFDDWSNLLTVPDLVPDFIKGEQSSQDPHASHPGEEVDDHAGEHDEHEEHEDDRGHEEPAQESGGSDWFSFGLGGWGGSSDSAEPSEPEEVSEPEASSSWFSLDYFGGTEQKPEESEEPEPQLSGELEAEELEPEDEADEPEDVSKEADEPEDVSKEADEPEDVSKEVEDEDEEEDNSAKEELDEEENASAQQEEDEEPLSAEQLEEDEEPDLSLLDEQQSGEIEETASGEGEDDDPRGNAFPRRSSIIEEDAESDEKADENEPEEEDDELPRNASEEELFPEAIEALQREALELLEQQKQAEVSTEEPDEPEAAEEEDTESATPGSDEETEGMALKFGVGVALVVVAHVVLVKKWNSWAEGNEAPAGRREPTPAVHVAPPTPPSRTPPPTPEPPRSQPPLADWAEEAIKAAEAPELSSIPPRTPTPEEEYEESEPEEELEEEEDLSEDVPPINPKIYEELIAKYGKPSPESSDAEASDDANREYSDGGEVESVGEEESGAELEESEPEEEEPKWTSLKKPAEVETESEGEEEEEEEESEDEPPPPRKPPQGGARSAEQLPIDEEELLLRRQLEQADEEFNFERYESALSLYRKVLSVYPLNVRAWHGVAQVLDKQAEAKKSNALLQEAIDSYLKLLAMEKVPDDIFLPAAQRTINRLRFRGLHMKAVHVHKLLLDRFNDTVDYHNDLAINYLMVNRLSDAESVLLGTLARWPEDPVARSHYGLVLKLSGRTVESIPHLQQGLKGDHPSTRDSRLYFHLGDALARAGRNEEAMQVYKTGVQKGLFLSEYQRSLYNVDHLTARPWWTLRQTTYEQFFKMLESNWKVIRDEGLSAMKLKGLYQDEAENLRDVGDWKQFQLFARGIRYAENCKKTPITCKIIGDFAPARGCKRGQSKFSVMQGGTHVWPHCGPTNCRLRAHLGLVVPPGPAIRVADETRKWHEGKLMVFDDSFEHEVWHNGTALRLVLIVDVWHPDLSPAEKASLTPI